MEVWVSAEAWKTVDDANPRGIWHQPCKEAKGTSQRAKNLWQWRRRWREIVNCG